MLRRLDADPRVSVAQPVQRFRVLAAGRRPRGQGQGKSGYNDPYADLQRDVAELSLPAVHRVATGKGVKVGVVDTGLDLDHPDLRGRVAGAGNFVESGERSFTSDVHGTAVAGILAAAANNQVGIVGVAPEALLYAFKACWQEPPASRQAVCDSYTLARAVDAALGQGVQVLNLSLSGPPDPFLSRLLGAALAKPHGGGGGLRRRAGRRRLPGLARRRARRRRRGARRRPARRGRQAAAGRTRPSTC